LPAIKGLLKRQRGSLSESVDHDFVTDPLPARALVEADGRGVVGEDVQDYLAESLPG